MRKDLIDVAEPEDPYDWLEDLTSGAIRLILLIFAVLTTAGLAGFGTGFLTGVARCLSVT